MRRNHKTRTGLVVSAHGRRGQLEITSSERMPFLIQGRKLKVVCGDRVEWQLSADSSLAVVTAIRQRKNTLERQPQSGSRTEILAANVSMMAIVCAKEPEPDWFLIDRYLCSAKLIGCRPLLLINKSDLAGTHDALEETLAEYRRIGYQLQSVSAKTLDGIPELENALRGQTAIFVGQSGVGKSSLINQLVPGAGIVTGDISTATLEGKHTTTASVLHDLPGDGRLIDTPGVRDFIPAIAETASIQDGFPEFKQAAESCRFRNCQHLREPECGIKTAVATGEIHHRRYESYKRLFHTLKSQQLH